MKHSLPSRPTRWALPFLLFSIPLFGEPSAPAPSTATISLTPSTATVGQPVRKPDPIRGVHLTAWVAGSKKGRKRFESLLEATELNTIVIDVKEFNGEVYLPGVHWPDDVAEAIRVKGISPTVRAIPGIRGYLKGLKDKGFFTIARIVVFQDQTLPKLIPGWAVQTSSPIPMAVEKGFDPVVWVDTYGNAWVDPYNPAVHEYNIRVAERAVELGFQGVQFDYIRFPSDGSTRYCVYPSTSARGADPGALALFLHRAARRLKPKGVELSIDVFGLAATFNNDMGIGQKLDRLIGDIDVVSPMMYPSHYGVGVFGYDEPNDHPYEVIRRSVRDTLKILEGSGVGLRPFFQDFSIRGKMKYTPDMVRKQIKAAEDLGVKDWMLWNAKCRYTKEALHSASDPPLD